jgi:hypothetical protein
MKKILLILSIVTVASFNTTWAESSTETPKKNKGGPMAVFKKASPMPTLMSVIVKHGDELGLSEEQNTVFNQWRVNNMGISLKDGNAILAEEEAISQAALAGKPNAEIEKMITSMLEKRQSIASNMLKCRDLMMKTLDTAQWEKLVAIYNKKS